MRLLKQPDNLIKNKFTRLGVDGHLAYFQCNNNEGVGIWRVDTLVPSSHELVFMDPCFEIGYAHTTMGYNEYGQVVIYILLLAIKNDDDVLSVYINEIILPSIHSSDFDSSKITINKFLINGAILETFYTIPIHNATLGVGVRQQNTVDHKPAPTVVYLYDGSIVQGDIPYWRVVLDRKSMSFSVENDDIPAVDPVRLGGRVPEDEPRMVPRFPIAINGAKRRFLRIGLDQRLYVFTEERNNDQPNSHGRWMTYTEREDNEMNIMGICGSRGLRETYSSNGHRMTAIESKYNLIVDRDICILKHTINDRTQTYWRLYLDDKEFTYHFIPCGVSHIDSSLSVGRQSYWSITKEMAVIVGTHEIAVVNLQPDRLSQIAFWTIQKKVSAKCTGSGALSDGWSPQRVAEILGYRGNQRLV